MILVKSLKTNIVLPSFPYKDVFILYGLIVLLVVVFYFLPLPIRYITSIVLLLGFTLSKKDYWWLVLFFIIYSNPWGLFSESTSDATVGLPIFSIRPGFSFSFEQFFLLIGFGKALYKKRLFISYFKNPILLIFAYFTILVVVAFIMGTSLGIIIDDLKKAIFWAFVFIFPALIKTRNDTYKFIYLILPIVILVFIDSLYFLSTGGGYLYNLINPLSSDLPLKLESGISTDLYLRFGIKGWHAVLIGYILSLAMAQVDKRHSVFLYCITGMAFIIVMISATRSWFIIFLLIAVYIFWRVKKRSAIMTVGVIFLIFFSIFLFNAATSKTILKGSIERIATVSEISLEGSLSNQAIRNKLTQRLPGQLELIKQNPITGWGFTENKGDMDVGIFGHWVEVGLIGLMLFFYLWYSYLKKLWSVIKRKSLPKYYRDLLAVFWIGFIGLLISHFTTNQIFGITYYTVLLSMYFWLSDFFLKESLILSKETMWI